MIKKLIMKIKILNFSHRVNFLPNFLNNHILRFLGIFAEMK